MSVIADSRELGPANLSVILLVQPVRRFPRMFRCVDVRNR